MSIENFHTFPDEATPIDIGYDTKRSDGTPFFQFGSVSSGEVFTKFADILENPKLRDTLENILINALHPQTEYVALEPNGVFDYLVESIPPNYLHL